VSRFPTPVERGVSDDVLVCVYLVALHTVFRNERRGAAAHGVQPLIPGVKGRSLQAAFRNLRARRGVHRCRRRRAAARRDGDCTADGLEQHVRPVIVAIDDLAYTNGPILGAVSLSHAITAVAAAVMSAVVIVGFSYRPQGRLLRFSSWIGVTRESRSSPRPRPGPAAMARNADSVKAAGGVFAWKRDPHRAW